MVVVAIGAVSMFHIPQVEAGPATAITRDRLPGVNHIRHPFVDQVFSSTLYDRVVGMEARRIQHQQERRHDNNGFLIGRLRHNQTREQDWLPAVLTLHLDSTSTVLSLPKCVQIPSAVRDAAAPLCWLAAT